MRVQTGRILKGFNLSHAQNAYEYEQLASHGHRLR